MDSRGLGEGGVGEGDTYPTPLHMVLNRAFPPLTCLKIDSGTAFVLVFFRYLSHANSTLDAPTARNTFKKRWTWRWSRYSCSLLLLLLILYYYYYYFDRIVVTFHSRASVSGSQFDRQPETKTKTSSLASRIPANVVFLVIILNTSFGLRPNSILLILRRSINTLWRHSLKLRSGSQLSERRPGTRESAARFE